VNVEDAARLREIRALVERNNRSIIGTDIIICQIYMESRFDKDAQAQGSSARGLMQLLKNAVRKLYRLENLKKPRTERQPESAVYIEADAFHDSPGFVDEATNIQAGTGYLQALVDRATLEEKPDPVVEAYKDYRGIRNGIYYRKIKEAAAKLQKNPDSMQVLRDMVK
jgi:soluble lytic murein transglycosylase-like protein